ncbi:hypothetical protein PIB30_074943 [Stylosanthes scabra]|uniref:Uncharacterized protein n=1 Tax=Stylosanthes scabra TaxID=79078 RepID=A0ABU6XMS4_9FABA|nr:hypothetical protein [Stylosanthes scabra]
MTPISALLTNVGVANLRRSYHLSPSYHLFPSAHSSLTKGSGRRRRWKMEADLMRTTRTRRQWSEIRACAFQPLYASGSLHRRFRRSDAFSVTQICHHPSTISATTSDPSKHNSAILVRLCYLLLLFSL